MDSTTVNYVRRVLAFFERRGHGDGLELTADLIGSGMLDSLELSVFLTYLEQEFDIDISAADVTPEHFGTVASTVAFLKEKTRGR